MEQVPAYYSFGIGGADSGNINKGGKRLARYAVTINVYGYIDTDYDYGAGGGTCHGTIQMQELFGSRTYFVDKVSEEILERLQERARKSIEEEYDIEADFATVHQLAVLPKDNETPGLELE